MRNFPNKPNFERKVEIEFSDGEKKILSLEEVSRHAISKMKDTKLVPDILKYGFACRGSVYFELMED
jgi:hypothetical protein